MAEGALRELLAVFRIGVENRELKEADKGIAGFVGKLKEFGKLAAEAFALHEIKEFVQGQIEAATSLKRTADMIGTGTTELQAFELAARESGVGVEAITTGLRFLNRNLGAAAAGSTEARQAFAKLGIAVKDSHGQARPAADVMAELADKIAGVASPAEKTRLAMTLLGRGGAALIPLLNKGGEAFRTATKDLEELGGGISEGFIEKAEQAEAEEAKLDVAMQGLKSTVATALLPAFRMFVEWARKAALGVKTFADAHPELLKVLTLLGGVVLVAATAAATSFAISMTAVAIETLAATAPFLALALALEEIIALISGNQSLLGWLFGGGGEAESGAAGGATDRLDQAGKALKAIKGAAGESGSALRRAMKDGQGGAEGMTREVHKSTAALKEAKKAADSFFGRGGPGQTPHADIPINWGKRLPKGFQVLGPDEAKTFGARPDEQKRNAAEFGFGFPAPPGAPPAPGQPSPPPGTAPTVRGGPFPSVAGKKGQPPAIYIPAPTRNAPSLGAQLAAQGITIQQTIKTDVEVNTSSDQPKTIGQAVGQGISTSVQRANERALIALRRP